MPVAIFLCVANSARSQMAEGLARAKAPPGWTFYSAGSKPGLVHPMAIQVLRETGIDISHHRSKGLEEVPISEADVIVRLCAEEECPVTDGNARMLSWSLPDPAAPANESRERFRSVRDAILERLQEIWEG